MNKSKRLYITLNPAKEKDLVILNYLKTTYSETETIKSILYQVATDRYNEVKIVEEKAMNFNIKEEQRGDNRVEKEQIDKKDKAASNNKIEVDEDIKNLFG